MQAASPECQAGGAEYVLFPDDEVGDVEAELKLDPMCPESRAG